MSDDRGDGSEAIAFLAVIPATIAAIGGFAAGGPMGAAAAGAGAWWGTYRFLEPRTRPAPKIVPPPPYLPVVPRLSDEQQREADLRHQHQRDQQYAAACRRLQELREAAALQAEADALIAREREREEAEAAAKRAEADAIHESWMARLGADLERVLTELKEGREAKLRDWTTEAGFATPGPRQEERKHFLTAATAQVEAEEAARIKRRNEALQKAQMEIWEAESQAKRKAAEARKDRLNGPIPLEHHEGMIVIGTTVEDGWDIQMPVRKFQHMLVGGMTGSGKSVFLHQLAYQLLRSADVERVVLIDLKGGTEFDRYSVSPKARVLWEFSEVVKVFDELVALLDDREKEMRSKGLREWNGGRVFVIVDEYAEIHDSIHDARRGEEKDNASRLANNLKRIIRRARSLGVVMICALQKPTTDAMDSTIRANMNFRVCFRVRTRQSVEAALDAFEELPVNPLELRRGRFLFDGGPRGCECLQAQIAPGVELGDDL